MLSNLPELLVKKPLKLILELIKLPKMSNITIVPVLPLTIMISLDSNSNSNKEKKVIMKLLPYTENISYKKLLLENADLCSTLVLMMLIPNGT